MLSSQAVLAAVESGVGAGRLPDPAARRALLESDDPVLLRKAGKLLARLAPPPGASPRCQVAVLATCTTGPFEYLLRAALAGAGIVASVTTGSYGTFEMSLATLDFATADGPDLTVLVMDESFFVPAAWSPADPEAFAGQVTARLDTFRDLVAAATARLPGIVLVHTIPLPAQIRDTFLSQSGRAAVARLWYQVNATVLGLAGEHPGVAAVDLAGALTEIPAAARDDRLHRYGDLAYSDAALLALAQQVRRVAQAKAGASRKVLALDLDNTLWGGVVGETGVPGVQLGGLYPGNCYTELQRTVARLRDQGVILVLASKNDRQVVERALAAHPEMVLRQDAFSATAVNWSDKAGNLRQMAGALSLATESFVFMDDSPHERAQVASELPGVALVAADGDPAGLVRSLLRPGWFDVMALTSTDRERPGLYRTRAQRGAFSAGFGSATEFLRALGMEVEIAPATDFTVGRIAQLAARTNQFNLSGIRFDEARTAALSADPGHLVASVSVTDRFGPEGIVGALWVECGVRVWRVLNLVLSCRVLGRGVELAAVAWLEARAARHGAARVEGTFTETARNAVSADFWEKAGYRPAGDGAYVRDLRPGPGRVPDWIVLREGGGEI